MKTCLLYLALLGQTDELAQVVLQALHVGIETLGRQVTAAVINGDTHALSNLARDLSSLGWVS